MPLSKLRRSLGSSLALALLACTAAPPAEQTLSSSAAVVASTPAWCAQASGGAPSASTPLLALSALHANARLFGLRTTFQQSDLALATAMDAPFGSSDGVLRDYVAALGDGQQCVVASSSASLGPAQVRLVGDVAVVRPGTGSLTLPAGAKAVAIDVRGLPNVEADLPTFTTPPPDSVRAALDAAAALALASPIQRPGMSGRGYFGLPDDDAEEADPDYYQEFMNVSQLEPIPAGSAIDLPLAILTSGPLAPAAAELAATLRLANRAWLLGEDVHSEVAESTWLPLDAEGVALRMFDMLDPVSGVRWPDVIPADTRGTDIATLVRGLDTRGAPPPLATGASTRPTVAPLGGFSDPQPSTLSAGEARSALVTLHGALRIFFGNFSESGDHIDQRLKESLAAVDLAAAAGPLDRTFFFDVLRRFGQALGDGHNFTFDEARPFTGFIPLQIEEIDGEPVVRRSGLAEVQPGDAIVGIDGVPARAWYASEWPLTSAATDRYRFNLITRKVLLRVYGPRTLDVRAPDGHVRRVVAQPLPYAAENGFGGAPIDRPSGFLGDLNAPSVFYLNMTYEVSPNETTALAALADAQEASAIIVDMRGYPNGDHGLVDSALMPAGFDMLDFLDPIGAAPNQISLYDYGTFTNYGPAAGPPTYTGPVVLLVGTDTVSAAEDFSSMLVDNKRPLHVVGRSTAGTNGDITGIELPGHYSVSFTGEDIRNADGSQYIGLGVTPDVPVTLTQANVANGNDPELAAALASIGK